MVQIANDEADVGNSGVDEGIKHVFEDRRSVSLVVVEMTVLFVTTMWSPSLSCSVSPNVSVAAIILLPNLNCIVSAMIQ